MVKALIEYTGIWRKGCTPPDAVTWTNIDNNKAFLAQTVVLTPNGSLSIPAALKRERPGDYDRNIATIDWPDGANGQPLVLVGFVQRAVVFKAGGNPALAGDFVRFLAEEGWLAHWLTFMGDQYQPPMRKLVEQPFWLDSSDPHRMRSAIQILTRPHLLSFEVRDNEWRATGIQQQNVWGHAVHRVVTEGVSPERAVERRSRGSSRSWAASRGRGSTRVGRQNPVPMPWHKGRYGIEGERGAGCTRIKSSRLRLGPSTHAAIRAMP